MKCSSTVEKLFAHHIDYIWEVYEECVKSGDYEEADKIYDKHLGRAYADYFRVTGKQYGEPTLKSRA